MIAVLAALLGCVALSSGGAAGAAPTLLPDMVFTTPEGELGSGANAVLAPNTVINGTAAVSPPLDGVPAAQACSTACRATTGCQLFEWCGMEGGCPLSGLDFKQCQLLALPACTLQAVVQQSGWPVLTTTGFPARQAPQEVSGYTEEVGHGIAGADFPCPLSVLPGKCAYSRLLDAASMCVDALDCRAVVWYFNGTDGCSEPVGVLKREGLSPSNSFVAPGVATLQQEEEMAAVSSRLFLPDGEVVLPSDSELEAGVAAAAASGVGLANDTAWRGCFIGRNAIMDGDLVGTLEGVVSAEACCRACRALVNNASQPACNAFTFCNQTQGCSYADPDRGQTFAFNGSQCELRWQALAAPGMGWPPTLQAKGPDVPFYAGGPIAVWGPQQEGYERHLGFGLFTYGRFNCSGSLQPQLQECALSGSMDSLVDTCEADNQCVAFVLKPGGLFLSAPSVGIFKHASDPSKILFNPTGVLYVRLGPPGGRLSAAAIAGIAVGAVAGTAALACAAWLLVRRRRRAADALPGKAGVEGGSVSSGPWPECDPGSSPKALDAAQPQHLELQPAEQQQAHSVWLVPARAPSGSLVSPFAAVGRSASTASSEAGPSATESAAATAAATEAASTAASTAAAHSAPLRQHSVDVVPSLHTAPSRRLPPASSLHHAGSRPPLPPGRASFDEAATAAAAAAAAHQGARAGLLLSPHTPSQQVSRGDSALPRSPTAHRQASSPHSCVLGHQHSSTPTSASGTQPGTLASEGAVLSSAAPLPELVQHVAAQDDLAVGMGGGAGGRSTTASGGSSAGSGPHVPVCAETLPARLREWVVDPAEVHYCRWPDGRLQELGAGASAHVYRAMFHGEHIAAKEIEIGRSPAMQEAFLTEALRLHELRHANVVSFFGVTFKRDTSAAPDSKLKGVVLMEYAEGRDLHSALELCAAGTDQRLFGWYRRGRRVAYDVAKALNYLHSKSVVHMDIKSSNVLLTASGTAKLGDVAFSRVQTNTFLSDLPLVGTFAWVAPEVLMGGRQCTAAVDLYSFGVVLWEIVTGMRPQRGCMRAPRVPEECPQEVADLIDACLSQDPAERPTAMEALQQLSAMLGPRGTPSGGPLRPSAPASPVKERVQEEPQGGSAPPSQ